jgi:hypothetical protein
MIEGLKHGVTWRLGQESSRGIERLKYLVLGPTNNSNDEDLETKYDKRITHGAVFNRRSLHENDSGQRNDSNLSFTGLISQLFYQLHIHNAIYRHFTPNF